MQSPTTLTWSPVARWLHWIIALLIIAQVTLAWIAEEMGRKPATADVMVAHKSLGLTIMLLALLRLAWRWAHPVPPPPAGSKAWEIRLAQFTHSALYLLLVAVPLSGWLVVDTSAYPWKFWWVLPLPSFSEPDKQLHHLGEELHEAMVILLMAVLALHVTAAIYHHFVRRDDVLLRMLGRSR